MYSILAMIAVSNYKETFILIAYQQYQSVFNEAVEIYSDEAQRCFNILLDMLPWCNEAMLYLTCRLSGVVSATDWNIATETRQHTLNSLIADAPSVHQQRSLFVFMTRAISIWNQQQRYKPLGLKSKTHQG